jgi:hypothetical protein
MNPPTSGPTRRCLLAEAAYALVEVIRPVGDQAACGDERAFVVDCVHNESATIPNLEDRPRCL